MQETTPHLGEQSRAARTYWSVEEMVGDLLKQIPRYSKGAALVIQALIALEDERETIWTDRALLTISDLSPIESALARALRSNEIWNETMRHQLRQGFSGKPGTEYLRPQSRSGFPISVLQTKAEQEAANSGEPEIGERHLAKVMAEWMRNNLRGQGIDPDRLVAEVTAMEQGPADERIGKALELERLRFARTQEDSMRAAREKSTAVQVDSARRGLSGSGLHMGGVIDAHVSMLKEMAMKRIEIRNEIVHTVPELASNEQLARLRQEIYEMIDAQWANLHIGVASYCGGVSVEGETRRHLDGSKWADTPMVAKTMVDRELGILEREASLGVAAVPSQSVTINIHGSTVAALNLGTVMGNIQATVATLQQGDPEMATALRTLIETVAAEESLGDQRRDVIESLSQVGEEATKPEGQRRTGLVKTLLGGVAAALAHSANIAQIWQTYGPAIARYFGLPWP